MAASNSRVCFFFRDAAPDLGDREELSNTSDFDSVRASVYLNRDPPTLINPEQKEGPMEVSP